MSGCGAVWLARYLGVVEVAGSSPVTPTIYTGFKPHCQWNCQETIEFLDQLLDVLP